MDPYKELGISRDASEEEIKSAYRTLAKRYHPDANPQVDSAEEKMNRINAAYAMLRGGTAQIFPEEDWFSEEAEENWFTEEADDSAVRPSSRNRIFYHPLFRKAVVIGIAACMVVIGIVSAFFSALTWYA